MTVQRTLLCNGTDLRSMAGVLGLRFDLLAPGIPRGGPQPIPRKRGQRGAALVTDSFAFGVLLDISGSSEAQATARFRAVGAVVRGTNYLVALERHMPNVGGTYDTFTAAGQFTGFSDVAESAGNTAIQATANFLNLDGAWWDGSTWIEIG